jgi:hypothetical protein
VTILLVCPLPVLLKALAMNMVSSKQLFYLVRWFFDNEVRNGDLTEQCGSIVDHTAGVSNDAICSSADFISSSKGSCLVTVVLPNAL